MKLLRRQFLNLAAGAVAFPVVSRIARAEIYPSRPITIVVPFPAGGPGTTIARILTDHLRRALGQPLVIENVAARPAASAPVESHARHQTATRSSSAFGARTSQTEQSTHFRTTC